MMRQVCDWRARTDGFPNQEAEKARLLHFNLMCASPRLGLGILGLVCVLCPAFAAAPVLQHSDSIAVVLGDSISYHVVATGGVTGFAAQGLPGGVAIDPATGLIAGTPSAIGTYPVTVSASNADGTSTVGLRISVVSASAAPLIYAPLIFDAYNDPHPGGGWFTCTLKATGSPTSFNVSDTLPPLWTFNSGTFVGPTDQPGVHVVNVTATNSYGVGSAAVTVRIHPACIAIQQTTGTLHPGDVFAVTLQFNRPVSFTGTAPYLEFSNSSGGPTRRLQYVSGNGTSVYQFAYTVTASDAPGDITLYTTIQPADGAGVSGLADQDGMNAGAALPIVGPTGPAASIAAAPTTATASTGTTAGAGSSTNDPSTVAASTTATTSTATSTGLGAPAPATPTLAGTPIDSTSTAAAGMTTGTATLTPGAASGSGSVASTSTSSSDPTGSVATTTTPASPTPTDPATPAATNVTLVTGAAAAGSAASGATSTAVATDPAPSSAPAAPASGTGGTAAGAIATSTAATDPAGNASPASPAATARLVNLSARAVVGTDQAHAFIAGFVVSGTAPKRMLLRAVGPTLSQFGVQAPLADPRLEVFDSAGHPVAGNDNWSGANVADTAAADGAFALPVGSRDAAVVLTLPPGSYSMQVTSGGGSGVVLAEAYDADTSATSAPLINLSTRANVGAGEDVLTAGFVVSGNRSERFLIRGVGPALAAYGVTNALSDPTVTVYHGNTIVARNNDWQTGDPVNAQQTAATAAEITAAEAKVGAFSLPAGSHDAALIVTLPPGAYSAVVTAPDGKSGTALAEVYQLPQQ